MRPVLVPALVAALVLAAPSSPHAAVCGCDKPPPKHAVVRPAFAPLGWEIILFSPELLPGRAYEVRFVRRVGLSSGNTRTATVDATAVLKRDQADFRYEELKLPARLRTPIVPKPQIRVTVPVGSGPPGPRAIQVVDGLTGRTVIDLPETEFTVIGDAVELRPRQPVRRPYVTATDADGYLYVALDVSRIPDPTVISGLVENDADRDLRPEDIIGYNSQGWSFDSLANVPDDPTRFGWEIIESDGKHSDVLRYWRHSFRDWEERHRNHDLSSPAKGYGPDADDPVYWHEDGTPHVDHHRLVVAVKERFVKVQKRPMRFGRRMIKLRIDVTPGPNFKDAIGR